MSLRMVKGCRVVDALDNSHFRCLCCGAGPYEEEIERYFQVSEGFSGRCEKCDSPLELVNVGDEQGADT